MIATLIICAGLFVYTFCIIVTRFSVLKNGRLFTKEDMKNKDVSALLTVMCIFWPAAMWVFLGATLADKIFNRRKR